MTRPARILVAGGGTGGHVYPAIAVADAVRRQEPDSAVAFAGTRDRIEWEAVPKAGYPIYPVTAAGVDRRHVTRNATMPFKVVKGLSQSVRLVGDFDADVVVGTGGFVAAPVGVAAWIRRRPLLLQEQNAFAGVTNRLLGRLADQIHIAFPEASKAFPEGRVYLSGNPVRADLDDRLDASSARERIGLPLAGPVVLMFGGSLGSQAMNEALLAGAVRFLAETDAHLIWQTGSRYYERVRAAAPDSDRLHLREYVHDMPAAYAAADVVLCRSGASTCAELLATGSASILVPSPNVAEDHQTHNARSMEAAGAAEILRENSLASEWVSRVSNLLADEPRRRAMAQAAARHAVRDAADRIARSVLELAGRRAA